MIARSSSRETLLARAELLRDPIAVVVGHRAIGSTLFTCGDFVRAQEHLEGAISLARQTDIQSPSLAYAVDPRIAAQLMLAWDLWILGYPRQALDKVQQALEQAIQRADPYSYRLRPLRNVCCAIAAWGAARLPRARRPKLGAVERASDQPLCALFAIRAGMRTREDRASGPGASRDPRRDRGSGSQQPRLPAGVHARMAGDRTSRNRRPGNCAVDDR